MPFRSRYAVLSSLVLAAAVLSGAARGAELDPTAPLPVDPSVKMGALPNGMRYWIRKHATPPGKVGFWLHIGSGSLNESDDQRGLAHFLEHMAFNGSKNFAPGTLVKFFESLGMQFGADQNAFTSFDQTTYILTMPNVEPETISKGMTYFADVAYRLDLPPAEIDRERGVVLEEKRMRNGPQQRLQDKEFPVMLPGSLVPERMPIGTEEVLKAAQRERFEDYYKAWYRPEISTLIVVGDIDVAEMEQVIQDHFAGWPKGENPRAPADPKLKVYDSTRAAVFTDPEITRTEISVVSVRPKFEIKSIGDFRTDLVTDLGTWIFNRRMRELVQNGKAPFQRANAGVSDFLNVCTYVGGEAIGQPEQWKPILASLQTELKRARVHGLLQQELDDVKKEMLASAEQAAKTEATQDMHNFLGRMNGDVARGRKPMSAQQRLELLNALMPGIALEEVSKSFASYFDGQNVLYMLELPEKEGLPVPTDAEFLAAAKEAEGVDVQPWAAKERPTSLMEQEPAPGKIASQEEDADLKIRSVTFENGVHAHFRSMDFKKNQAWCRILIGGGLIQETAANRGASDVAALAFQQTATRKLDSTTVRDLMTGKNVNVGGGAGRDHFALTVSGEPKDFEEGLRLAYLLLTEPKIEDSALKVWKERTLQSLEQLKTNVRGQMGLKFRQELYDNDPRFDVLSPERVDALSAAEAQAWLEGILKSGFVEVAFVGDMPLERMVELAARYLGALPKRDAKANHLDDLRKKDFPAGAQVATVEVKTITDRAEAVFGWRTPDERSVHEFRMIEAASMILRGRLREEIRENKSLTYSIGSFADSSSMFFDGGLLGTVFSADPAKVEEATKLSKEVILKFAAEGPTDEELETTHKQFKTELDKNYEEPGTWVSILGDLDFHGNKLEYVKQHIAEMSTFTKDALMAVVKKYLVEDRYRQVIATPVK